MIIYQLEVELHLSLRERSGSVVIDHLDFLLHVDDGRSWNYAIRDLDLRTDKQINKTTKCFPIISHVKH